MSGQTKQVKVLNAVAKEIDTYEKQEPSLLRRLLGANIVFKLSDFMTPEISKQRKEHENRVKSHVTGFSVLGPLNVFVFLLATRRAPSFVKWIGSGAVAGGSWYWLVRPSFTNSLEFSDSLIEQGIFEHFKDFKAQFDANPDTAIKAKFGPEQFAPRRKESNSVLTFQENKTPNAQ